MHYNITAFHPIHKTDPKGHYVAMLMVFLINQIEKQSMTANGMYYERYSKRRLSPNSWYKSTDKILLLQIKTLSKSKQLINYYIIDYWHQWKHRMARNWGRMNSTVKTVWTTTIPYKTFVHVIVSSVYKFTWYTACQVQEPCKDMHTMYKCTTLRGPKLVHTSYGILWLLVSVAIQKTSSTAATKIIF